MRPRSLWLRLWPALSGLLLTVITILIIPTTAVATESDLVVTGEPTGEELAEIEEQWERFAMAFEGFADCMGPVEVRVVARAEDWYGGRNVGSIAAFYRFPPEAIVFIEHRKVVPHNLLHEFAHHLDASCGIGESATADRLKAAQGLPEQEGWMSGGSWSTVPAEVFAEAVVAFFDEPTSIDIQPEAVQVIDGLTGVRTQAGFDVVQVLDGPTGVPTLDPWSQNQGDIRAETLGILRFADASRCHRLPVVD